VSQVSKQFDRVQRAFLKVLDNHDRNPVDYEDDVWNFFQNCWHLADWIKSDTQGVAKATRGKIEVEVRSYPALMMVGELTNKNENLEVISNVAPESGESRGEILLTVIDKNGEEYPVKNLAIVAMKNWMAIFKKFRL